MVMLVALSFPWHFTYLEGCIIALISQKKQEPIQLQMRKAENNTHQTALLWR